MLFAACGEGHCSVAMLTADLSSLTRDRSLGVSDLQRPVDGDEQVQLALLGADLGEVDVHVADGV